jgi:hypothetical protein
MKTLCKSDPLLDYWKSPCDLPAYLADQIQALNPLELAPLDVRLEMLCVEPVGCILVVVQYISATAITPLPTPTIMLVTAPLLATLGNLDKDDEPGVFLTGIWQESVLQAFGTALDPKIAHHPPTCGK